MTRKIIFLINPVAGTGKKETIEQLIKQKTNQHNIDYEIIHSNPAGNYDFLKDKIKAGQFTDVVIAGGDGTVNQVVSSVKEMEVCFGIIPAGSGNACFNILKLIPTSLKFCLMVFLFIPMLIL